MNFNRWVPSREEIYDNDDNNNNKDNSKNNNNKKYHRLAVVNSMNIDGPARDEVCSLLSL